MHQALVIKRVDWVDGSPVLSAVMEIVWEVRVCELIATDAGFEPGRFLFLLKMTRIHEGSLVPDIPLADF